MESAWVQLLETSVRGVTLVAAAERLERYGTEATAARVAQAWLSRHADWTPDADGPLFAFLTRVNPALAVRTLAVAARDPDTMLGAGPDRALPAAIAAYEWNDTVERFALESLPSGHGDVVRQSPRRSAHMVPRLGVRGLKRRCAVCGVHGRARTSVTRRSWRGRWLWRW
jgi:hypothetical protein